MQKFGGIKTLKDLSFKNKRTLVRCDFNVPLDEQGKILDDFRIKESLRTIEYLIGEEARVILISHLGRPKEIKDEKLKAEPRGARREMKAKLSASIKNYSLKPIAERLEKLLDKKVIFLNDSLGEAVEREVKQAKSGDILLLENLRFYKEEEKGDLSFAKELASLADVYVNDAFGASHRAHASIVGIAKFLPSAIGFLMEKEIDFLSKITSNQKKPLIVIIGGAKVETKTRLIDKMSEFADFVLIGGLLAKEIKEKSIQLKYPQKVIEPINENKGKDIGPKTLNLFKEKISSAKAIFWNGPLGQIEKRDFTKGTKEIARAIVKSRAFSVAGGGETVEFVNKIGLTDEFNHLSTGGGAMLEFLSGDKLPGLEALRSGS